MSERRDARRCEGKRRLRAVIVFKELCHPIRVQDADLKHQRERVEDRQPTDVRSAIASDVTYGEGQS